MVLPQPASAGVTYIDVNSALAENSRQTLRHEITSSLHAYEDSNI